ncbi:hypothetical protein EF913_28165 [Streptomyces sp. WAC04189]|uniref:hypothetical protein n=1 Tax=Streptomyces sp. WAC04189 TaxID=2487411 RepID=UPI000FB9AA35|nr:hypothetical protein [Streptomyces sp. WAC04189]RSR98007.1 hypothetical protein EF913_28165 [Streptomyces sp. WAC04189]
MSSRVTTGPGPRPRLGQTVHYVSHGTPLRGDGSQAHSSRCRAAIVTAVHELAVNPATLASSDMWIASLCVLNPTGFFLNERVVQMEYARDGGTWHTTSSCDA